MGTVLFLAGVAGYAAYLDLAAGPVSQVLGSALVLVIGAVLTVTGYVQ